MIEAKRMRVMLDVQPVMGRQTMLNFTCYQPTLIGLVKTKSAYIIHQFILRLIISLISCWGSPVVNRSFFYHII